MQTKFGRGEGNCTSACIASILELDTEAVPNFALAKYDWVDECQAWLSARGWQMIQLRFDDGERVAHTWFTPGVYVMMGGISPRSTKEDRFHHAVVGRTACWGVEVVHDPHPSGDGLLLGHEIYVDLIVPYAPQPTNEHTVIADFYRRVCQRAERNMELTGVLEGAHWNALRSVMKDMGIPE